MRSRFGCTVSTAVAQNGFAAEPISMAVKLWSTAWRDARARDADVPSHDSGGSNSRQVCLPSLTARDLHRSPDAARGHAPIDSVSPVVARMIVNATRGGTAAAARSA